MTSTARQNVRGNNGPDRKRLPNYQSLGSLSWAELDALRWQVQNILRIVGPEFNDINNGAAYQIAQDCPLKTYFPSTYRQVLLQHPMSDGVNEEDYILVKDDFAIRAIGVVRGYGLDKFYRARLAVLPPGETLDWHIDTNTSVSCRIQIPVFGSSSWEIKRQGKIEAVTLRPGDVWFANTGYAHRVVNPSKTDERVCLVLSCHFGAIKRWFNDVE